MGTAHSQIHPDLLPLVERQADVLEMSDFGDGSVLVLVSSPRLPDGYNGVCDTFFREGQVHFTREKDV